VFYMKNPWIIVGLVAAFLIGGSVWYSNTVSTRNNEGVTFSANVKGNPDAVVKLVEYSDLQCPACASFQPILNEIINEYGADLSFEYKHFPLPIHNLAEAAARAAEAAGQQDAFFAYHDLLFANQATWSKNPNPSAFFIQYAEELSLDTAMFKRHMNASLIREKVQKEGAEARELGLTGTPTFFLNGERMKFTSYEEFKTQIAAAINPQVEFGAQGEVVPPEAESTVLFGI
jgi:protein-disulfide isomerase